MTLRPRSGFTLVEILIVTCVMALIVFPLLGYFTYLTMSGEAEETDGEATTLAANIVTTLMSPTVPFDAIRPAGDGAQPTGALTKSIGGVTQAAFTDERFERLICDRRRDNDRIKVSRKGLPYRVYFFAGIYHDQPDRTQTAGPDVGKTFPDPGRELTFSYLPGPYGDRAAAMIWGLDPAVAAAANQQKILPATPAVFRGVTGFSTTPYLLGSFERADSGTYVAHARGDRWGYSDKRNYFRIPGWPRSPIPAGYVVRDAVAGTDNRQELAEALASVASRATPPTWGYHPVTADQGGTIAAGRGALMKIVVGVRWRPYNWRVATATPGDHEFWLVSFKARLEDP